MQHPFSTISCINFYHQNHQNPMGCPKAFTTSSWAWALLPPAPPSAMWWPSRWPSKNGCAYGEIPARNGGCNGKTMGKPWEYHGKVNSKWRFFCENRWFMMAEGISLTNMLGILMIHCRNISYTWEIFCSYVKLWTAIEFFWLTSWWLSVKIPICVG